MVLLCKQKALYVKCCIIANGIMDSQGDTLYAEDIKKIFTSFNNQDNFEVYHNDIPISEVSLLENYISSADETIGTAVVPSGSWNAVIRVDNPEIQEKLLTGEFKGVSLNNRLAPKCKGNLTGIIRYKDVVDAECIIPLLISFVKGGANGYGLHVMDYEAYIKKSKTIGTMETDNMAFDLKEGLRNLLKQADETPEEPAIKKEDETQKEEVETNETSTEPVVKKEDTTDETKEEDNKDDKEASIEKEDDDDEFEAKVTAIVKKILAETKADNNDDESDETPEDEDEYDEDTPRITKSRKIIEDTNTIQNVSYFEVSGRDPVTGMKIRK